VSRPRPVRVPGGAGWTRTGESPNTASAAVGRAPAPGAGGPLRRPCRPYAVAVLLRLAITWVFNALALLVATWLLSGLSYGDDAWALLVAALVFTLVNTFLKPVLAFLSIPFIIVTLGIFYLLINVFMLYLTSWIVPQFTIETFWWGLLAAVIVSFVNMVLGATVGRPRELATR
jgi:putative membrane protein